MVLQLSTILTYDDRLLSIGQSLQKKKGNRQLRVPQGVGNIREKRMVMTKGSFRIIIHRSDACSPLKDLALQKHPRFKRMVIKEKTYGK